MPENWQVATTSQVVWILKNHWMCCIVSAFTVKLAVAIVDWGFINCVVVLLVVLDHVIQQQYDTWSPEENDISKRLNSNLILWVHGPSQNLICYCVPLYIGLQDPLESSLHFSKILMNSKNTAFIICLVANVKTAETRHNRCLMISTFPASWTKFEAINHIAHLITSHV